MDTPSPAPAPSVPPYDPYQQPAAAPSIAPGGTPVDPYAQQQGAGSSCAKMCLYAGIVIIVLAALGIGGCAYFVKTGGIEKIAQKAMEQGLPEGAEVKIGNLQDIAATIEEGKNAPPPSIVQVEGFANGWISDVPLYPGAAHAEDGTMLIEGKNGFIAKLTTADGYAKVFEWYKTELEKQGWAIPMAFTSTKDGSGFVSAIKGERMGQVTCETKNAITTISLSFSTN